MSITGEKEPSEVCRSIEAIPAGDLVVIAVVVAWETSTLLMGVEASSREESELREVNEIETKVEGSDKEVVPESGVDMVNVESAVVTELEKADAGSSDGDAESVEKETGSTYKDTGSLDKDTSEEGDSGSAEEDTRSLYESSESELEESVARSRVEPGSDEEDAGSDDTEVFDST